MMQVRSALLRWSERDLEFLVKTVSPGVTDTVGLSNVLKQDEAFRNQYLEDEKIFEKVMDDQEILLKISPALFFEILLRRTARDLSRRRYTFEKEGHRKIPVFDTQQVSSVLAEESLVVYLADMLASFTKVQSYTFTLRVKKGVWRKIRVSDLDISSLMRLCQLAEEEYRIGLYKRIADICLFVLGIFPEYALQDYRYAVSGELRPKLRGRTRISPEEYEEEGRRFYRLAAEHHGASELGLAEIFRALHENFREAKKPLNFVAEHYLPYKKGSFFLWGDP